MRTVAEIFRSHAVLDERGRHVNGSDKQSNHNYGDAYELLFFKEKIVEVQITETRREALPERYSVRDQVKLVMEVGVADGSCLLAWREIFPNATVVGMDVERSSGARVTPLPSRVEFWQGDMRVHADCLRAAGGRQFDLIVEDATHRLEDTLRCLLYLWPHVRPGGIYVVEEFDNVGGLRDNIRAMWPHAEIVDTQGPFGGVEPLVVFRKPL